MATKAKTCFVMMPISDPDGYAIGHFADVYKHVIQPACREAGFEPLRADQVNSTNYIALDVLHRIYTSEMALCDVSARTPNVLYELGLRHAARKPVTIIKDIKTDRIFDIQGIRTTPYDESLHVQTTAEAVTIIAAALKATFSNEDGSPNSLVDLIMKGAEAGPTVHYGACMAQRREQAVLRGEVVEWNGRHGRIFSHGRSYYTNSRFLARGVSLELGSIAFFQVMPPMQQWQNEVAACVVALDGFASGEVAVIQDTYGFAQITDGNANARQIWFSASELKPGVTERSLVTFRVAENDMGPQALSIYPQRRGFVGHPYARFRSTY